MALAWENNPAGICEDAPCCGCCGPHGDGAFDPFEPPDFDDEQWDFRDEEDDLCQHGYVGQGDCPQCEDEAAVYFDEPSPDPDWMNP